MSEKLKLLNIKACVFDAYGTLFDIHSAVGKYHERLGEVADQVSITWRTKQLEYTWLRSLMQKHADFWQVTQDGLDYALDVFNIKDNTLRDELIEAYLHLNCYPEVPDTLKKLKNCGQQIAILSNGSPKMLEAAVENCGIGVWIDKILSVETVGVYKPDPRVYQLAVDKLGVAAHEIVFQSSNSWDAIGAKSFGLKVAWINRFEQRRERLPFQPDIELKTLSELPALLGV